MPDKWEHRVAAWDLASTWCRSPRSIPSSRSPSVALFLREWYMHPNGQPGHEWALDDVNPPVHAWAVRACTSSPENAGAAIGCSSSA